MSNQGRIVHPSAKDRRNPTLSSVRPLIGGSPRKAKSLLRRIQRRNPNTPGLAEAFQAVEVSLVEHRRQSLRVYRSVFFCLIAVAFIVLLLTGRVQFWPLPRTSLTVENAQNAVLIRTLREHDAIVWDAAYAPAGSVYDDKFASCGADGLVILWDGASVYSSIDLPEGASALAWSADGSHLYVSDFAGAIWTWNPDESAPQLLLGLGEYVYALDASPDGQRLAAGAEGRALELELSQGKLLYEYATGEAAVDSVSYGQVSTGDMLLAAADENGGVYLLQNGSVRSLDVSGTQVAFSPDADVLAIGDHHLVTRLDASTFQVLNETALYGRISAVGFSPDGSLIVVGTVGGFLAEDSSNEFYSTNDVSASVAILDAAAGQLLSQKIAQDDTVTAVTWSPDGTTIVTASQDATLDLRGLRW